jgi:hypothetical protein
VVVVAPEKSLHDDPPFVENCHTTVGEGTPEADAVKVQEPPVKTEQGNKKSVTIGAPDHTVT